LLSLIVAVAKGGVIGKNGGMPWHLPADLAWFKRVTLGHPVIMGRKTFDSIIASLGKPLPGRRNIVVTRARSWRYPVDGKENTDGVGAHVEVASSVEAALDLAREENAFVIGGATLYAAALPLATRLYLTEIDASIEGDTFFPPLEASAWELVSSQHHAPDAKNAHGLTFKILNRKVSD
jgi:dihydrofolate reductase